MTKQTLNVKAWESESATLLANLKTSCSARVALEAWRQCGHRLHQLRQSGGHLNNESAQRPRTPNLLALDRFCAKVLLVYCQKNNIDAPSVIYGGKKVTGQSYMGLNRMSDGRRRWEHDAEIIEISLAVADESPTGNAPIPGKALHNVIVFHEATVYSVNGQQVVVSEKHNWILQAFLRTQVHSTKTLASTSGVEANQIAKSIHDLKTQYGGVFANVIKTQGRKGGGGYRAKVLKNESE